MSSSCSEKNSAVSEAAPSRQRASRRQSSSAAVSMTNITVLLVTGTSCRSSGRSVFFLRNARRPPGCPGGLGVSLSWFLGREESLPGLGLVAGVRTDEDVDARPRARRRHEAGVGRHDARGTGSRFEPECRLASHRRKPLSREGKALPQVDTGKQIGRTESNLFRERSSVTGWIATQHRPPRAPGAGPDARNGPPGTRRRRGGRGGTPPGTKPAGA